MTDIQTKALRDALFALQDTNYKAFHEKLIPTVPPETVSVPSASRGWSSAVCGRCWPCCWRWPLCCRFFCGTASRPSRRQQYIGFVFCGPAASWGECPVMSPALP